ncbi:MAG: hypothetical protein Q8O52_21385 [Sulfuritalea sp.]|nr:hypothetical protein [Sulfuritalea sp.]
MKTGLRLTLIVAMLSVLAGTTWGEELTRIKGRIVGQMCAEKGKIGECYLKWADPMVFWTDEGDTYAIDLAASAIKQERLDEAYGLEVDLYGKIIKGEKGVKADRVRISQLNILKPPGSKEFFKG